MSQVTIKLLVYPNPSDGIFTLAAITDTPIEVKLMIVDPQGRIMLQQQWNLVLGRNLLPMNQRSWQANDYFVGLLKDGKPLVRTRYTIQR